MNLSNFLKYDIPFVSKFWNEFWNPWYHWYQVKDYFKRPKGHCTFTKGPTVVGILEDDYNPIISINTYAVGWNDKDNKPYFVHSPAIDIVFFKKWHLTWEFRWNDDFIRNCYTWEAIIDYLYYNVPLNKLVAKHTYEKETKDTYFVLTPIPNMTELGKLKCNDN